MRNTPYIPITKREYIRLTDALAEARLEAVRARADVVRIVCRACKAAGLSLDQIRVILDAATEYETWYGFTRAEASHALAAG